jgi:hypothetical protein
MGVSEYLEVDGGQTVAFATAMGLVGGSVPEWD